jgi:Clp amino terminal domain, pathogenicity island component
VAEAGDLSTKLARAMESAVELARDRGHSALSPLHVIVALGRRRDSVVGVAMRRVGVTSGELEGPVWAALGVGDVRPWLGDVAFDVDMTSVWTRACREAARDHRCVRSGDIVRLAFGGRASYPRRIIHRSIDVDALCAEVAQLDRTEDECAADGGSEAWDHAQALAAVGADDRTGVGEALHGQPNAATRIGSRLAWTELSCGECRLRISGVDRDETWRLDIDSPLQLESEDHILLAGLAPSNADAGRAVWASGRVSQVVLSAGGWLCSSPVPDAPRAIVFHDLRGQEVRRYDLEILERPFVRETAGHTVEFGIEAAGQLPEGYDIPISRDAERALFFAALEAQDANRVLSSVDFILGILRRADSTGAEILSSSGIDLVTARRLAAEVCKASADDAPDYARPLGRTIGVAKREAFRCGHREAGTRHLILAVLDDTFSPARLLLDKMVSASELIDRIERSWRAEPND